MVQAAATLWAGALLLCGLAMLFGAGGWVPVAHESPAAPVRTAMGVTAVLASQAVLMCWVSDRAFPRADRRIVLTSEIVVFSALGMSALWVAWRSVLIAIGAG